MTEAPVATGLPIVTAVRWDGCAHTANVFVGEEYGNEWRYTAAGSTDIIIRSEGEWFPVKAGDWIIKANGLFWCIPAVLFDSFAKEIGL